MLTRGGGSKKCYIGLMNFLDVPYRYGWQYGTGGGGIAARQDDPALDRD